MKEEEDVETEDIIITWRSSAQSGISRLRSVAYIKSLNGASLYVYSSELMNWEHEYMYSVSTLINRNVGVRWSVIGEVCVYMVIQKERLVFLEVIMSVISTKKIHIERVSSLSDSAKAETVLAQVLV